MDLTEAEHIKKRWQEYTEELYKKHINDPDNHNGVIPHPEPDILEGYKVKWALRNINTNKISGVNEITVELFQIQKDDTVKSAVLNMPANMENSAVATELEKVSFHSNPKEGKCQRIFKAEKQGARKENINELGQIMPGG